MLAHHPALWIRHGNLADGAADYRTVTAAPTLVTEGVPVPPDRRDELTTIDIAASAVGAYTFTIVVWGYKAATGIYLADGTYPAIAGANGPGWTNLGAIDITGTGAQTRSAHQLQGITGFTRLYAQATSVVGAASIWTDFGFSLHQKGV